MQRFWIESRHIHTSQVQLEGSDYHHICRVCRIEPGEHFELITDTTAHLCYVAQMQQVGHKKATACIVETRPLEPPRRPYIHLALAQARPHIMDRVIEKSVELGVHSVKIFTSQKSQRIKNLNPQRWQKIIHSTMAQCGRAHKMQVQTIPQLENFFVHSTSHKASCSTLSGPSASHIYVFAYEKAYVSPRASSRLGSLLQQHTAQDITLFVGPEGGFTDAEAQLFSQQGVLPVSLGPQVLKVETACVALISILNYELKS